MSNLALVPGSARSRIMPGRLPSGADSTADSRTIHGVYADTPPVCLKCDRLLLTVRHNAQVDITITLYLRVRVGMGCKAGCDQRPPYRQGCGRDEGRQPDDTPA